MKYYETLYIINPNLADEDYREVVNKFNELVEKNKGVLVKVDEWGKKTLAYLVKKFDKGYYILLQYCGQSGVTEGLEKDLRLDDRVLKYQTIKLSNNADPEALKAEVEEREAKTGEDLAPAEAEEVALNQEARTESDQEEANGVYKSE